MGGCVLRLCFKNKFSLWELEEFGVVGVVCAMCTCVTGVCCV